MSKNLKCNLVYVMVLTSDDKILARIYDCCEAGKRFSIQQLDLNLSQQGLQNFDIKLVKNYCFYVQNDF